ncbi:MAG TPA: DUF4397 domain-containing protein [Chloroflexota bacterium]|jgi:hypothetical protein|nr:DUF4397 domain-containing protein [Chloroflexota bacterium]
MWASRPRGPEGLLGLLVLVVALGGGGPRGAPAPAGNAQLRVAHLAVGSPMFTLLLDGERQLARLAYGQASDYLVLPAGAHTLVATAPEGDSAAAPITVALDLQPGICYTVVLLPADTPPLVLVDESLAPMGGPPRLRLVHAADGVPPLDLAVGATPLVRGLAFGAASPYYDAPAGTHGIVVYTADGAEMAGIPDATLAVDTAYTLVAAARTPPGAGVALLPLVDGYPPVRFAAGVRR